MVWRSTLILVCLGLLSACAGPTEADVPFHIMLVNDDGIDSPGLAAVATVLTADPGYRVTVVGPAEQQSGVGHAIVIRREIALRSYGEIGGARQYVSDPAEATIQIIPVQVSPKQVVRTSSTALVTSKSAGGTASGAAPMMSWLRLTGSFSFIVR